MKDIKSYISEKEKLSIRHQCELLGVNRSSIYYNPVGETDENLKLMRMMDQEHLKHPHAWGFADAGFSCRRRVHRQP